MRSQGKGRVGHIRTQGAGKEGWGGRGWSWGVSTATRALG